MGYATPSFPSLYIPKLLITSTDNGIYLYEAGGASRPPPSPLGSTPRGSSEYLKADLSCAAAIWRFTVYWTILILCVVFLLCSLLASVTIILSLTVHRALSLPSPSSKPLPLPTPDSSRPPSPRHDAPKRERPKRKRPSLWPVCLLPVIMTAVAAFIALITGTVVGFTIAAVYAAGGFSVST